MTEVPGHLMANPANTISYSIPDGYMRRSKKPKPLLGENPYGDRITDPADQFTYLAYSELQAIRDALIKLDSSPELLARVEQQLQRSDAVLHAMDALSHMEFVSRFFVMRGICVFCGKQVENPKDVKIHIARKHFAEVAFGPETKTENLRSKGPRSGSWYVPNQLTLVLWRDSDFADNWGSDPEQNFSCRIEMIDEGEFPWPDGNHSGALFSVQELGGHEQWGFIRYDYNNKVWVNHRDEVYNRLSLEVEIL